MDEATQKLINQCDELSASMREHFKKMDGMGLAITFRTMSIMRATPNPTVQFICAMAMVKFGELLTDKEKP